MNAFEHCPVTDTGKVLSTEEQTCACPTSIVELWVELVMLVDRVN